MSTQRPTPTQVRSQYSGVLDFRSRQGEVTGSYNATGSTIRGGTVTNRVHKIFSGGDLYDSIWPQEHSSFRWRKAGGNLWGVWSEDEKALTSVRDAGSTQLTTGPTRRFTGMVDVVKHRTIHRPPRPGCFSQVLVIDLYIDDRTGELVRYDHHMDSPATGEAKATPDTAGGMVFRELDSFTDFGVQAPKLTLPDPATIEPKIKVMAGPTATLTLSTRSC